MSDDKEKPFYGEFYGGEQVVCISGRYYRIGRVAEEKVTTQRGAVPVIFEGEKTCAQIPEILLFRVDDPSIKKLISA